MVKRIIKDETILELFKLRDKLLGDVKTDDEKLAVHMACKGIFKCPKSTTAVEKTKCFDSIKKKLNELGGKKAKVGGGSCKVKSRAKSKVRKSR
jgi:hypothetical protein